MSLRCLSVATAVVRVTGEDAAVFLQGQCTADLRKASLCDTLWLNRKGRVLAHTIISRETDDSFLLLAPKMGAADLIAVVTANVIADDVDAVDESAAWQRAVVWGDEVPAAPVGVRLFSSSRSRAPSWEVLAPLGVALPWSIGTLERLEANRITAGIPAVPADCGAHEFPQECGLEPWVSYTKGCYLGQEVMARIQSMGSLRRVLRCVQAEAGVLTAGLELHSREVGKVVGTVRSAAGADGLALVSVDLAVETVLHSLAGPVRLGSVASLPVRA